MVILYTKGGTIMKLEDIKIEDSTDANCVIRKFFDNDFSNVKMTHLEQLVLTVYAMGKKDAVSADGASDETESKSAGKASVKASPFKINDRVKILEDVEIGHSGEFIKADSVGAVTLVNGETTTVLFEAGEEGEMIEINVMCDKLEKAG
jgi:hypothetical protein